MDLDFLLLNRFSGSPCNRGVSPGREAARRGEDVRGRAEETAPQSQSGEEAPAAAALVPVRIRNIRRPEAETGAGKVQQSGPVPPAGSGRSELQV